MLTTYIIITNLIKEVSYEEDNCFRDRDDSNVFYKYELIHFGTLA